MSIPEQCHFCYDDQDDTLGESVNCSHAWRCRNHEDENPHRDGEDTECECAHTHPNCENAQSEHTRAHAYAYAHHCSACPYEDKREMLLKRSINVYTLLGALLRHANKGGHLDFFSCLLAWVFLAFWVYEGKGHPFCWRMSCSEYTMRKFMWLIFGSTKRKATTVTRTGGHAGRFHSVFFSCRGVFLFGYLIGHIWLGYCERIRTGLD